MATAATVVQRLWTLWTRILGWGPDALHACVNVRQSACLYALKSDAVQQVACISWDHALQMVSYA